jgi:zinc protease
MRTAFTTLCLILGLIVPARGESLPRDASVAINSVNAPPTKAIAIAKPWPKESSDLKADPKVVWGKLDNGLRYVILPSDAPGRASLQMYLNVGSRMEADDQRGMAHFLEHMAFNGTKHFAAGEMVEYFQRLGMKFGAHTNAETRFDRTVYKLELPRTNEEMTGQGLKLFRDFLDGMLLDSKEIDRERRVICAELLDRNSAGARSLVPAMQFAMPDTILPQRIMPGGTVESVRALSRKRFVDFYETWYTPARATIVAAGKFDVPMVERLIRRQFEDAKARRGERPDPPLGKASFGRGTIAGLHSDPDADSVSVSLSVANPVSSNLDSVARRAHDSVLVMANAVLNGRFQKLVVAKDAPIQAAGASYSRDFDLAEGPTLGAGCRPDQWKAALGVLEQELRRAVKYGFTDAEFEQVKAMSLSGMQAMAEQADNRPPATLAGTIVESLIDEQVFVSPADSFAIVKRLLADLKKSDCEQALRKAWDSQDVQIWLDGNLRIDGNGGEQILAAYRASQSIPVQPSVEEKAGNWAYTDFGPAGQIVKREIQKDLDIVEAVFDNNVHVNVKRTAFEKNVVRVEIRFGGGMLELPADKPGLMLFANSTFMQGGLEAHHLADVNRIFAGKNVGVGFSVGTDAFQLFGNCSPSMLDMELQICAADLVAPAYRPEARDEFLAALPAFYAQDEHTPERVIGTNVAPFLRSGDERFVLQPLSVEKKFTMDDLKAWMSEPLRNGYMEIAIVGDIDPDAALRSVAKTLGALPKRAAVKPSFAKERQVRFPTAPKNKEFRFVAQTPRAISLVYWPTDGARDVARDLRTGILANVLADRLRIKVRQELGATYSPHVTSYAPDEFPDYGCLEAEMTVEPKQAAEIGRLVDKIGADVATNGISDDEFQRAIKPVLSSLDDMVMNNGYWSYLLGRCQEDPTVLDVARNRKAEYTSITKQEIEVLARKYLSGDKATVISIVPSEPAK